jgi:transposase
VIHKEKSVHKAAKLLNIKYSTAKAIVKRFKDTGFLSAKIKASEEVKIEDHSSPL